MILYLKPYKMKKISKLWSLIENISVKFWKDDDKNTIKHFNGNIYFILHLNYIFNHISNKK